MKAGFLKVSCLIAGAMAMVACGGNSGSGIFGEMPNIYREKIVEFALKGKSMAEDVKDCSHEEALDMLEEMREYVETVNEEIKTELTPHIDELKGTSIPCEVSDSVPYTLVGDMTITDVTLPKLKLTSSSKPLALHVEGAVVCTDTIYEYNEYFGKSVYMLMSTSDGEYVKNMTTYAEHEGERHFVIADASWGGTYEKACLFPGDTLKMKFKIEEEDMPIDIVNKCEKLHFVTKSVYDAEKKIIDDKKEAWEKLIAEELGMDE